MTLRSSDLQSDSDLDSIRNSYDVFNFVCVQAFIIWITVVEVMVYPFVLEPVLWQAPVCPPTAMFDARLFTFEQIIILTTMKLKNKI